MDIEEACIEKIVTLVDAMRSAAACAAGFVTKAEALKDSVSQLVAQDAWESYKEARRIREEANGLLSATAAATKQLTDRDHDLREAVSHMGENALTALVQQTAEQAYKDADRASACVSQLVSEVRQATSALVGASLADFTG